MRQNKTLPYYSFFCLFFSLFLSCKNTPEVIAIPSKIPVLPQNGTVSSEESSFFKKDSMQSILFLSKDGKLEITDGKYSLKEGTLLETTIPAKRKYLKNIRHETMFPAETGSFSFFRLLIPKSFKVENIAFHLEYFFKETSQDSKEGTTYPYYEDSDFYFYGVYLPFSPLYNPDQYLLSLQINFLDNDKVAIYSTGSVQKKNYPEQNIHFPKNKSKELKKADRGNYQQQQALRHKIWRTVTAPLIKRKLEITPPLKNTSRLTSEFCFTRNWLLDNGKLYSKDTHLGVDYGAPEGTPIYSLLDGIVVSSSLQELYGNMIIVDHGLGLYTNYCHMSKLLKTEGAFVEKGEVLGEVGMTGASTGPHLHIETRIYGIPIDYRNLKYLPDLFLIEK